jgi:3-hydroxyacyl-[acyl-carrier-protein] dehydratase
MFMIDCEIGIHCFQGNAYVEDKLVAEAELKATFAPRENS